MAKAKRHISTLTTEDLISEADREHPGFADQVDARVAELALARKIRRLRERRGLTQAELAELAGTGQAAIARIESGKAVPKLDLLARIASALGARLTVNLTPAKT